MRVRAPCINKTLCFYNGLISTASIFRKAASSRELDSIVLEKQNSPQLGEAKQDN